MTGIILYQLGFFDPLLDAAPGVLLEFLFLLGITIVPLSFLYFYFFGDEE